MEKEDKDISEVWGEENASDKEGSVVVEDMPQQDYRGGAYVIDDNRGEKSEKSINYTIEDERVEWTSKKFVDEREVDFGRLKEIANRSEVITAILNRNVDDTLRVEYDLVPVVDNPDREQKKKAHEFLSHPNPESVGFNWAETIIYDYRLLSNAFVELVGSEDKVIEGEHDGKNIEVNDYGGKLEAIYDVDASTIRLLHGKDGKILPEPPEPAYAQVVNGRVKGYYTRDKLYRMTRMRQGGAEGRPDILCVLDVLMTYQNTNNHYSSLMSGKIPRSAVNLGPIPKDELERIQQSIKNQLESTKNNYGLIMLNGVDMELERMMDTPAEGEFLDLLRYNREIIYMVWGCPPMKLAIVETGKLANPSDQLDTWYDGVEMNQARLQEFLNYVAFPLRGITDYHINFISPRPRELDKIGKAFFQMTQGISMLRDRNVMSVDEARNIINDYILDKKKRLSDIGEDWSKDPGWIAPDRSSWTKAKYELGMDVDSPEGDGDQGEENEEESLKEIHFFNSVKYSNHEWKEGDKVYVDGIDDIKDEYQRKFFDVWNGINGLMGERIMDVVDSHIENFVGEGLMVNKDVNVNDMMSDIDKQVAKSMREGFDKTSKLYEDCYKDTQNFVSNEVGVAIAFSPEDLSSLEALQNKWRDKTSINTVGTYNEKIRGIINDNINENWRTIRNKISSYASSQGINNPKYVYDRIAKTESYAVIEASHLNADADAGFTSWRYLVADAPCEICAPWADRLLSRKESQALIPRHPNCACSLVPEGVNEVVGTGGGV